jgi:selenocysteine-specific elongation factor
LFVIGTAGHVDHGKSALVQALTGIDPDRLREEKERGMTIDLGFAWLRLPSGREVSIVDVPGHERFIKNMLAGVGGIDLALLVIAADEGVMPQTREHLAILDLLRVSHGLVVVTKSDLVDAEWLDLVTADVSTLLEGTSLASSPIVACSATTRAGLEDLVATIDGQLESTPQRRDIGRPRLPIDRAFTLAGFGTVVTGTLLDGSVRVGQEVEVVPGGFRTRIRGLQSHRTKAETIVPGNRCAANLAGVAVEDLRRGMVVTTPGWLKPTVALDASVRAVPGIAHALRHGLHVTLHTAAAEAPALLRLLDRDELAPGDECLAQLRLGTPVVTVKGDLFVLRTPNDTVGGGVVIDPHARRHRRNHAPTLQALAALLRGTPEEVVLETLARVEPAGVERLAEESELTRTDVDTALATLAGDGRAVVAGALYFSRAGFERLAGRALDALQAAHRAHPLRPGVTPEELRTRSGVAARAFPPLLEALRAEGRVTVANGAVARAGFEAALPADQAAAANRFVTALEANPNAPPTEDHPDAEVLAFLEHEGRIVRVADGIVFGATAYAAIEAAVVEEIRANGPITLARVRDLLGTSRRYAQALLEYMDQRRVTARVGDERVLRGERQR